METGVRKIKIFVDHICEENIEVAFFGAIVEEYKSGEAPLFYERGNKMISISAS